MTSRPEATALEMMADVDLIGREAIVTGGYSGIGYETARALATAGARVVIAGRDRERGEAAAVELTDRVRSGPVVYRHLDLSSLDSVNGWAARHCATGKPCHILVANAGVMAPPLTFTDDGFELQFGVNHLGHFSLVTGLLPSLRAAGDARVVVVTSTAHRRSRIDFQDPNYRKRPYDRWQAYGQSKTANALFALALHRRHGSEGITANAVSPGAVASGLQRHLSPADRASRGWPAPDWKTPEQGAATVVWASASPALDRVGGRYLEDCAIARPWEEGLPLPRGHYLPYALDTADSQNLWDLSRRLVDAGVRQRRADEHATARFADPASGSTR